MNKEKQIVNEKNEMVLETKLRGVLFLMFRVFGEQWLLVEGEQAWQ